MSEKKILIVEDELIIQLVNKQIVEQAGYKVCGLAADSASAIQLMKESLPDLILMDIKLEGEVDGIDTMKAIRVFSNVPVIYVTGNSDDMHVKRARETGMSDFLIKPVDFNTLIASIEKALT